MEKKKQEEGEGQGRGRRKEEKVSRGLRIKGLKVFIYYKTESIPLLVQEKNSKEKNSLSILAL